MTGMAEFTDISGIFADSEKMVAECKGTVYGYLRVSTAAQKHDRQVDAMKGLGVKECNMFFDRQSGKDFDRPGYKKLLAKLRENDLLVIKNIDRLGRNTREVKEQWRIITQEKKVSIVVIDTPVLNAGKELGPLGQALSDIIFAIFSMVADFDRQSIYQRLKEGLAVAMREKGVRPGRKARAVPGEFYLVRKRYENGEISLRGAAKLLGADRKTFKKWLGTAGERPPEAPESAEGEAEAGEKTCAPPACRKGVYMQQNTAGGKELETEVQEAGETGKCEKGIQPAGDFGNPREPGEKEKSGAGTRQNGVKNRGAGINS